MKPVVIIAISVVCSVVAVLGVLVALEMYAVNEAQKAYAIELERQAVCERLYDGYAQSLRDTELWGICINYGIINAVNDEVSDCGTSQSYSTQLCKIDTKILAMKVVNEELTLDEEFRDSFSEDLDTLQVTRQKLLSDRQIEEQQNKIKYQEMAFIEQDWIKKYDKLRYTDWYLVYQECMNSEIEHYNTDFLHKKLCDDSLKSAISNVCKQGCNLTYQNIVSNTVDPDGLYFNTEQARYEQKVSYCASMGGGYYAPLEEVKGCMCGHEIDYSGWYELCRN